MKKQVWFSLCLGWLVGLVSGIIYIQKKSYQDAEKWKQFSDKHLELFLLMIEWMKVKHKGKNIEDYFIREGFQTAAIYGMSYVGECLAGELKGSHVEIKYAVDQKKKGDYQGIKIIHSLEELQEVDVIIVTAVSYFDEIQGSLMEKTSIPIVSLTDILLDISI